MNHPLKAATSWPLVLVCCSLVLLAAPACQWLDTDRENFLFVFVEDLGFDAVSCGRERDYQPGSGLQILCEDSVQFSHAYTNSPLSPVALASFFTASSPSVHGAGAGGERFLSSRFKILSEVAWEQGLHTWMFSGGAPVFRKSGLSQGFEVFEDHVPLHRGQLFTPFKDNIATFLRLLGGQRKPAFFAVFYVPDLLFQESETVDSLGLPRERSYEGQLEEVNEALGELFQELKRRKLWSRTHVVVSGLNSKPLFDRPGEIPPTNLFSERVHIALFVKPARVRGEHPQSWKVNHNVSLMDLGATYFDWIEGRFATSASPLAAASLKPMLQSPGGPWNSLRPLEITSDWAEWRQVGNIRRSLRVGNEFFLFDDPPLAYNTLMDRLEMSPRRLSAGKTYAGETEWRRAYDEPLDVWLNLDQTLLEKIAWARTLFGPTTMAGQVLEAQVERQLEVRGDHQVAAWLAQWALEQERWELLDELGRRYNQPFWLYLASQRLQKDPPYLESFDCGRLFLAGAQLDRRATFKDCQDGTFVELINWVRQGAENRPMALEIFLRDFFREQSLRRIGRLNYLKGLSWDVPLSEPRGPTLSELFLRLPGNESLWRQVQARWRTRLSQ